MFRMALAATAVGACLFGSAIQAAEPAIEGNCVVCLYEMDKLVPGASEFASRYDRETYRFPGAKQKKMFDADPTKYVPALGGDCVVCKANMGVRMPGKAEHQVKHNGRLYLFPGAKQLEMFKADPDKYVDVDLALQGYCSVCLLNMEKLVPGKPEHSTVYDGVRYLFPGAKQQKMFGANPAKYAPALGGDCAPCLKNMSKHVAGSLQYGAFYEGRIFLNAGEKPKKAFFANPAEFVDLDLANGGDCVVCEKMMKKKMPGSSEHVSVYKGMRYLFPGEKQKAMFEADPESFVAKQPAGRTDAQQAPGATRSASAVSVIGTTACAGCDYGKKPIADADSLGIAVVADKKVYIVEQGESLYPELFGRRFDGLKVELDGRVKRREGEFVWVTPRSLKVVR